MQTERLAGYWLARRGQVSETTIGFSRIESGEIWAKATEPAQAGVVETDAQGIQGENGNNYRCVCGDIGTH